MTRRARAAGAWRVYMLECAGGRIYTGITKDLAARFAAHSKGRGGAFTRSWRPVRILAVRRCGTRSAALKAEAALKRLQRPAKLAWAARFSWPRLTRRRARAAARTARDGAA